MQEALDPFGVRLILKVYQEDAPFFSMPRPDFAIVRSILPSVNKTLEQMGVRTFNNAQTAQVACDKWATFKACAQWGIPVLFTSISQEEISYPCVIKAREGHGGNEVFWANSAREAEEILLKNSNKKGFIFQTPNEILGEDIRVYAIGGEIVASVKRNSKQDFRSNFSLGGEVSLFEADETQKAIVKTLYEKLKFDYIGVDFLPTKTGWVLNEIEDSAGARMLYACSDLDIISLYAKHIASELGYI